MTAEEEPWEPLSEAELEQLNKKFVKETGGLKIFLVNGEFVRDNLDIEFTMFSDHLDNGFIPENEVWIDCRLSQNDVEAMIHHEIVEIRLMKEGMPYEEAHKRATESEMRFRKSFR